MIPKISLLIPTFNRAYFLDQTLFSIARQTMKPFEVLIIDNASTDNTQEIVRKYQKYGFRYIQNKTNIGMIRNWNRCIELAKGDYVSFINSDDLIAPYWYETWIETIKKYKAKVYTSSICVIDKNNKIISVYHTFERNQYIRQPNVISTFCRHFAPSIGTLGATIFDKTIFTEIGLYDPKNQTEADVPIGIKILSKYDIYYKDALIFAFRSHEEQTFDKMKQKKTIEEELKRLDNYFFILKDYSKEKFNSDKKIRFFILTHLFMTLAAINMYIIKLHIFKIINSYKIAFKHFPSLFSQISDWQVFLRIQFLLFKRTLFCWFLIYKDRKRTAWLNDFRNQI